jgi:polyglutamine-binding protein 1
MSFSPPPAGGKKDGEDAEKKKIEEGGREEEPPVVPKKKPLPKALLERLKKKGIIKEEKSAELENKKNEETENVTPPPLPKGWKEGKSVEYDNHTYYYNPKLNKSRWTRPKESSLKKKEEANNISQLPPFYWKTSIDKKTKREYYYNEKTKYCTWVIPEDPAAIAKMIRCANCGGFGQGLVKEHGFCNRCARELQMKRKKSTKKRVGGQKRALVL